MPYYIRDPKTDHNFDNHPYGSVRNWGPHNKDPTIWGTIIGSPIFGNSHMALGYRFLGSGLWELLNLKGPSTNIVATEAIVGPQKYT